MAKNLHFDPPREPVPAPWGSGDKWWHYAIAILITALAAMYVMARGVPRGGAPSYAETKDNGDNAPTDAQVANARAAAAFAEREGKGVDYNEPAKEKEDSTTR